MLWKGTLASLVGYVHTLPSIASAQGGGFSFKIREIAPLRGSVVRYSRSGRCHSRLRQKDKRMYPGSH